MAKDATGSEHVIVTAGAMDAPVAPLFNIVHPGRRATDQQRSV